MIKKIKELFYWLAYIDLEHTRCKEETYFYKFSKEIGLKNLMMIRNISAFLLVICVFVIVSTYTYFVNAKLRNLYFLIFAIEMMNFIMCCILIEKETSPTICNLITSFYLLHMLILADILELCLV